MPRASRAEAAIERFAQAKAARYEVGFVDRQHYTAYVPEVQALLASGDDDAAAGVLLRLIEAVEREAAIPIAGCPGVPEWYFTNLADIYRRASDERARGQLMQRYTLLDAKAQTDGLREQARLEAAAPGIKLTVSARSSEAVTPSRGSLIARLKAIFGTKPPEAPPAGW